MKMVKKTKLKERFKKNCIPFCKEGSAAVSCMFTLPSTGPSSFFKLSATLGSGTWCGGCKSLLTVGLSSDFTVFGKKSKINKRISKQKKIQRTIKEIKMNKKGFNSKRDWLLLMKLLSIVCA